MAEYVGWEVIWICSLLSSCVFITQDLHLGHHGIWQGAYRGEVCHLCSTLALSGLLYVAIVEWSSGFGK